MGDTEVRIAVVGGGPGGLFAATLAKAADPSRNITVFERNGADDTFGFGVVFSDATLDGIHRADPVLRTALDGHGVHWDPIEVRLRGRTYRCGGNGMAAVERRTLLKLLQQRALEAGVDVRFSTPVQPEEILASGYDLVVAADGANSRLRERLAAAFGPGAEVASAKFIWLGTTYPFAGLTFVHERGPHGVYSVHGYPIGNGLGTFIVETDDQAWRAAGLDAFDTTQPPGPSDERSRAYLEELFSERIDGHPVLVNNSRWDNFRTRRTSRWWHREGGTAVALLGDAAHTAHFSVGSGTKMAMEDAVALAAALDAHTGDLDAALAAYEEERRPQVARIQGSARPSLSWWEHVGRSHDGLPPWQFAYHFFTRSLPESKLRQRDPGFVDEVHRSWRRDHGADPIATPLDIGGARLPGRLVELSGDRLDVPGQPLPLRPGPPGDGSPWALVVEAPQEEAQLQVGLNRVTAGVGGGATLVAARGGSSLTRRLLTESARLEHGTATLLIEPAPKTSAGDVATTAILSGRADLVAFEAAR